MDDVEPTFAGISSIFTFLTFAPIRSGDVFSFGVTLWQLAARSLSSPYGVTVRGSASEYQRALQVSPHSPVILNKLGRVMIEMNRPDEALGLFKKSLDVDPDNVNAYVQLGRAYHATKNFKDARTVLEEAIQINPFNPLIYRLLGDAYNALGEPEKAQQAKLTLDKLVTGK